MKTTTRALLAAATIGALLGRELRAADEPAAVADFLLEAADGARVSLMSAQPGRELTVVAFLDVDCAVTRALAPALGECERACRDRGVRFLGIDPRRDQDAAALAAYAAEQRLDFPLLRDPWGLVAQRMGATHSGEVFVLDADFRVVYRGAPSEGGNDYLADAIESALAGETIDPAVTEAAGAALPATGSTAAPAVTFFRDVAPILWKNCVECHRPGQVGPMAFLDVDEAAGWSAQIAEVVADGRMPPWSANPRFGHFRNARRLTDTEKRTLAVWAETGSRPGDPKDAPPAPTFADPEWLIGKPDRIFELPEEQSIPAEGVVNYRYVPLDPHFTEDLWVQSVEVRPTARAATHHVIAYLLPPGMSPKDALRNPETVLQLDAIAGYAPGKEPEQWPDGQAHRVLKGSTILFELHYTPVGKPLTDRTKVGIRLARAPVTHEVKTGAAMNFSFRIPPRKADATFQAEHRFRSPAQLLTFMPHMHKRGAAFRYELERKDGSREVLLDVPRYDFNWQHTYVLAQPVTAAAGDTLRVTAVYDNSKANPFNPNPDQWVRWGDQTFEEMMIGYFDFIEPRTTKE